MDKALDLAKDQSYMMYHLTQEQLAHILFPLGRIHKENEARDLEHPVLFDGIPALLEEISDQGGRNFLVSHRNDQVLEILSKTKIAPYFTEVVTASSGFKRKPNPESMIYLRDKYQITSGLVIGDRAIDVEAGLAAGLDAYLFENVVALKQAIDM